MDLQEYYSNKSIQKAIVEIAKNRETQVWFTLEKRGKRPDILQYEGDIFELAKQGATSFHLSEEHWSNALDLQPGMPRKQLDDLRIGWDLFLDIDCKYLEFSKITAFLLVEALKFHDIETIFTKFSGGTGFHIAVPFEAFPPVVNNTSTHLLFPEGVRTIASYLNEMIKDELSGRIMEISKVDDIQKATGKKTEELVSPSGKFNPFSVIEIDSVLISSRHMFRAPYSINEKRNLVSVPVEPDKIMDFNIQQAKMENIKTDVPFLNTKAKAGEGTNLIIQAFDWAQKKQAIAEAITPKNRPKKNDYKLPKIAIKEEFFPPCVKQILKGLPKDGRKRAVFILINFLQNMGWTMEKIEKRLLAWNKENYEPLREGYIKAQITWFKRQNTVKLPPNCSNESYYKAIGIECNPRVCFKIKNPVNFTMRLLSNKSRDTRQRRAQPLKKKTKKSTK